MHLTCLRAFVPQITTCLRALNYFLPTCLKLLCATCLHALIFHVPPYLHFSRAYVLTYVYIHFFMPAACLWIICQSSHRRYSSRNRVLRNFAKLTGKHLWPATLFKKRLLHRCFPVNVSKFLRTMFYGTPLGDCFCIWPFIPFKTPKTNTCF